MGKNKLTYLSILTLLLINTLFTSCSNEENTIETQKREPELFADFNLIDGNYSKSTSKRNPGVKVTLTIGRKSRNCSRIGICKVKEVTIQLKNSKDLDDMTFTTKEIQGQNYLILALTSFLDSSKFDTNLYVDEDIIDEESGIIIPAATYEIDNYVGNYGGYKVLLNKYK